MISIARSSASGVTSGCWGVGWPSYTSEVPPRRSSPSLVGWLKMMTADATVSPITNSSTKRLRRLPPISLAPPRSRQWSRAYPRP
jgi:hypothetical protein